MSVEEDHFSELFGMVYDDVTRMKGIQQEDVAVALNEIKESFQGFRFHEIDLSHWIYSCAYCVNYGAHGAGLTRCRALEALQKCEVLATKFKKPNLSVISLGSGPGNDIIGLCSALKECNVQSSLNIKVTDSVSEWSLYLEISQRFIKEHNFGNASDFFRRNVVNLAFLQVSLPANPSLNPEYFQSLRESDVILMVKFLSSATSNSVNIVESIRKDMKDDALILCIDAPFEPHLWSGFEVLYLSEFGDYYYRPPGWNYGPLQSTARVAVLRKKIIYTMATQ